jgi:hypothetical protein
MTMLRQFKLFRYWNDKKDRRTQRYAKTFPLSLAVPLLPTDCKAVMHETAAHPPVHTLLSTFNLTAPDAVQGM